MARKTFTVQQLAAQAQADLDEALVNLWDAGIDYVDGPDDLIFRRDTKKARNVLGLVTANRLREPSYWEALLGIDDIKTLLLTHGHDFSTDARRIPEGAVGDLKAHARSIGINPITGIRVRQLAEGVSAPEREPQPPPFRWRCVGHEREIRYLTMDEVYRIHHALVEDFRKSNDPIEPPGIRSKDLLESAVFRPQTGMGNELKYPTVEMVGAALLHSLVHNHPFHNGNKRTALVAMLVFLDENGVLPTFEQSELFKFVLRVSQHSIVSVIGRDPNYADREVLEIAEWLCRNSRLLEKGDKPTQWRKLRTILRAFDCHMEHPSTGNRINIFREVSQPRRFGVGKARTKQLRTQVYYANDGRDAPINTIQKVREDLRLDEVHGVDASAFYRKAEAQPEEFINRYRKTLWRLSRL